MTALQFGLNGISELRRQVEQILAILGEEADAAPAAWFWLTMSDQERDEKFSELSDWVETVFRAQYPGYLADQIRPCWPNHPEARWELAWLYQQWSLAYLACLPRLPTSPAGQRPETPPTGTTAGPQASSTASARSWLAARGRT